MSDKADNFLQNTNDGAFMYVSNPELYKRLCGYMQSYAEQHLEDVLGEDYGIEISEACRKGPMFGDEEKAQCFRLGAKFLLNLLKQRKG